MNAIEVENLVKTFDNLRAVDNISFKVKRGEIFGLLGPNGAGKTTTIKILTTLIKPTKGNAKVWQYDVLREKDKVRQSIGVVFQTPALDNNLTGYENLDFHARIYGLSGLKRKKRIAQVLKLVELQEKANILVKDYSGGMQRRLEIARGLMHYPNVLFLDEPTLGLDTQTRRRIWDYILKLNEKEGTTIILTTHYMEEADWLCSRIAIIDYGKIIATGSPSELKSILGDDIVSITVSDNSKALKKFSSVSWIKKIKLHNGYLDLSIKEAAKKIPSLFDIARENKFLINSLNIRKPSLEDVFLHFTGTTIREREAFSKRNYARPYSFGKR